MINDKSAKQVECGTQSKRGKNNKPEPQLQSSYLEFP